MSEDSPGRRLERSRDHLQVFVSVARWISLGVHDDLPPQAAFL